jgi:hypothetical protein
VKAIAILLFSLTAFAQHDPSHHDHGTVESRGDKAMGFDQQKTQHHFLLKPDGGVIQVSAKDANDAASVKQIRSHLKKIAQEFKAGRFDDPAFIHDRVPPGVPTMQRLKKQIGYSFVEVPAGAEVRISSKDKEAVEAVRSFFKMQIEDHKTGDTMPEHQH